MALATQRQHRLLELFENTSLVELRCATSGRGTPRHDCRANCATAGFSTQQLPSRRTNPVPIGLLRLETPPPKLRHGGTPETILVTDLVTAHTSPGHDNGPQAELAGR
jgi:hypothetical protein